MDARLEADQLRTTLEQQILPEVIAPVHLQREPAKVAQLLLTDVKESTPLAPDLARRRGWSPAEWSSRDGTAGCGFSSQQSLQERDAHQASSLLTAGNPTPELGDV